MFTELPAAFLAGIAHFGRVGWATCPRGTASQESLPDSRRSGDRFVLTGLHAAAAVRRWPGATLLRARLQDRQWNCLSKGVPKWSLGTRGICVNQPSCSRRREAVAGGHALTSAATGSAMELPQQGRSQMEFRNEGNCVNQPSCSRRREAVAGGPRSYEHGYRIGNGIASGKGAAFPNGVWERGDKFVLTGLHVAAAVRRWSRGHALTSAATAVAGRATLLRARLRRWSRATFLRARLRRWPGATLLRARLRRWSRATLLRARLRRWPGATLLRARLRRWSRATLLRARATAVAGGHALTSAATAVVAGHALTSAATGGGRGPRSYERGCSFFPKGYGVIAASPEPRGCPCLSLPP